MASQESTSQSVDCRHCLAAIAAKALNPPKTACVVCNIACCVHKGLESEYFWFCNECFKKQKERMAVKESFSCDVCLDVSAVSYGKKFLCSRCGASWCPHKLNSYGGTYICHECVTTPSKAKTISSWEETDIVIKFTCCPYEVLVGSMSKIDQRRGYAFVHMPTLIPCGCMGCERLPEKVIHPPNAKLHQLSKNQYEVYFESFFQ